jgi:hypothetical protein
MTEARFEPLNMLPGGTLREQDTHHAQHRDNSGIGGERINDDMRDPVAMRIIASMNQRHDSIKDINALQRLARSNLEITRELITAIKVTQIPTNALHMELLCIDFQAHANSGSWRIHRGKHRLATEFAFQALHTRAAELAVKSDIGGVKIGPGKVTIEESITDGIVTNMR